MVPRRQWARGAGEDRLRAPLRAPHVRGLGARPRGRHRHVARRGGRRRQRLHHPRPHQLHHRRGGQRPRTGPLPRRRPHGLAPRRYVARERGRAARRGQERAPPELREPALRHGLLGPRSDPLPARPPLPLAHHRLDGRPDGGELPGRGDLLSDLLHTQQRQPRRRGGYRPDAGAGVGRAVVWRHPAWPGAAHPAHRHARAGARAPPRARRCRPTAAPLPRVARPGRLRPGGRRHDGPRGGARRGQEQPPLPSPRVRHGDRAGRGGVPGRRPPQRHLLHHRDRAARVRARRDRRRDRGGTGGTPHRGA